MNRLMISVIAFAISSLAQDITPPLPMAADATPGFEVATIKPSVPDAPGRWIRMNGRNFSMLNTSLSYLITFAYGIHARQLTGAPGWVETDSYNLAGIPDKPGKPDQEQLKMMVRKLLADRFKLSSHNGNLELGVYAITVAKTGAKA